MRLPWKIVRSVEHSPASVAQSRRMNSTRSSQALESADRTLSGSSSPVNTFERRSLAVSILDGAMSASSNPGSSSEGPRLFVPGRHLSRCRRRARPQGSAAGFGHRATGEIMSTIDTARTNRGSPTPMTSGSTAKGISDLLIRLRRRARIPVRGGSGPWRRRQLSHHTGRSPYRTGAHQPLPRAIARPGHREFDRWGGNQHVDRRSARTLRRRFSGSGQPTRAPGGSLFICQHEQRIPKRAGVDLHRWTASLFANDIRAATTSPY